MRIRRTAALLILVAVMLVAQAPRNQALAAAGDNAVVHWNQVALDTVLADSERRTPSAAILYVAMVQAAVYDAVMAIEGTHEQYAFRGNAPPGAFEEAAVAAAAYEVLVHYFPSQKRTLDSEYQRGLATIPDGPGEKKGISVGLRAAKKIIASRARDGRDAAVPPPPDGTEPGEWRRTSSTGAVVTPYVAHVAPFLAESPEQFRPGGPYPLTSEQYAEEFERTRLYGAKTGSSRTGAQTEIAVFWTENTVAQYNRALRQLANDRNLSIAESALLFAMTDVPAADAMITCWNTKFHYLAWRPVTAIHEADSDGNPLTTADPNWQPLSTTALHPEYVSGHACLTGAITRGLQEFLGTSNINFSMTSTAVPGVTHHFPTVDDLRTEVEDARVYGGDHWTTGGTHGTALGDALAEWALQRYFQEI